MPFDSEKIFDEVIIGNGWRLDGRMDLVELSPDSALRVTDYKTGSYPDPPPEITGQGKCCSLYSTRGSRAALSLHRPTPLKIKVRFLCVRGEPSFSFVMRNQVPPAKHSDPRTVACSSQPVILSRADANK